MNELRVQPISLRKTLQINCPYCQELVSQGDLIIVVAHNDRLAGFIVTSTVTRCCGNTIQVPHLFSDVPPVSVRIEEVFRLIEDGQPVPAAPVEDLDRLLQMVGSSLAEEQTIFSQRIIKSLRAN